ncbi:hypothetical protein CRUP_035857 [Coryphaenoides rupestris]|nr:hypothetical protein CRUP_035857 [Coryphaenoides rupestris]
MALRQHKETVDSELSLRADMSNCPSPLGCPTHFSGSPGMKIYIDPFTYEDPNEASGAPWEQAHEDMSDCVVRSRTQGGVGGHPTIHK